MWRSEPSTSERSWRSLSRSSLFTLCPSVCSQVLLLLLRSRESGAGTHLSARGESCRSLVGALRAPSGNEVIGKALTDLKATGHGLRTMPRSKSSSAGPFDSFELTLSDVYLLTTQNQSEVAVPGLKIIVDPVGLTLVKPDGTVGVVLEWGKLQGLGTGERMQLPSGTPAVIVEAVSNSRTHRFASSDRRPGRARGGRRRACKIQERRRWVRRSEW